MGEDREWGIDDSSFVILAWTDILFARLDVRHRYADQGLSYREF